MAEAERDGQHDQHQGECGHDNGHKPGRFGDRTGSGPRPRCGRPADNRRQDDVIDEKRRPSGTNNGAADA